MRLLHRLVKELSVYTVCLIQVLIVLLLTLSLAIAKANLALAEWRARSEG